MKWIYLLLIYSAIYLVIYGYRRKKLTDEEKRIFLLIGCAWAVSVFIGNYILFKCGAMSFTPWLLNFCHTFIWIGVGLSSLYMWTRSELPLWQQMLYFVIFSFIIKYSEKLLFNSWEYGHFFGIFQGNFAYILGWSLMDGLYPPITNFVLRKLKLI